MHIAIKRIDGTEIASGEYPDIKTAVEDCARKGVSLKGAHLAGAYLAGAMLRDANLRGANLAGANLEEAYFSGADLRGADLSDANLRRVDLSGANLLGANLRKTNLRDACLKDANLAGANLGAAYFSGAYLYGANLSLAYLYGANFRGADLGGADFSRADLYGATLPDFQLCPEGQAFVAYKKLRCGFVATLEIAADVPRTSSLVGRKCRAQSARVLFIEAPDGTLVPEGVSLRDENFLYRTGEVVSEPEYDPDIRVECTQGVHFFMTKEEAQKYWQ
jgi:hypothetical protein